MRSHYIYQRCDRGVAIARDKFYYESVSPTIGALEKIGIFPLAIANK
ncbi:MAG: hypothetical protein ACHBN1_17630 [Heteroscytonema crispum UTEX LB 1556]